MFVNGGYLAPLYLPATFLHSPCTVCCLLDVVVSHLILKSLCHDLLRLVELLEHLRLGIFVELLKLYSCLEILPSFKILYSAVMERERKFDRHGIWLVKVSSVPLYFFR